MNLIIYGAMLLLLLIIIVFWIDMEMAIARGKKQREALTESWREISEDWKEWSDNYKTILNDLEDWIERRVEK